MSRPRSDHPTIELRDSRAICIALNEKGTGMLLSEGETPRGVRSVTVDADLTGDGPRARWRTEEGLGHPPLTPKRSASP